MNGPLAQVMAGFEQGSRSVAQIQRFTGLRRDLVEAAVDHLVSTGRLRAEPLGSGCPEGACGGCALVKAGCAGSRPLPSRGRSLSLAAGQESRILLDG